MKITQREILVLYLISHNAKYYNIRKLIFLLDRANFPSHIGEILDTLVANRLIYPTHYYNNIFRQPIAYDLSEQGKRYLKENFNSDDILTYIKTMYNPEHMLNLVQAMIDYDQQML